MPVEKMQSTNDLIDAGDGYCFSQKDEIYVVYLPQKTTRCNLEIESDKSYSVQWFNPRMGGEFQNGSIQSVEGPGTVALGNPPEDTDEDWVVILKAF